MCILHILRLAQSLVWEPSEEKLMSGKIKDASVVSAFKSKIKSWATDNSPGFVKCLLKILDLLKFVQVSNGIHANTILFIL